MGCSSEVVHSESISDNIHGSKSCSGEAADSGKDL